VILPLAAVSTYLRCVAVDGEWIADHAGSLIERALRRAGRHWRLLD
jgi:hypothetical protein